MITEIIIISDAETEERNADPEIPQYILESPTVLAVLSDGYDEEIVKYVVKKKIKDTGNQNYMSFSLLFFTSQG